MTDKLLSSEPRPRNSEDKLFQACLDACIAGIDKLQVDKRRGSSICKFLSPVRLTRLPYLTNPTPDPNNNTNTNSQRAATSPINPEPANSLPSPPPSPSSSRVPQVASSLLRSPASTAPMDRSMHSAPPRGPSRGAPPPGWGSQDARSNLAVQPAANAGSFRLKKNAVKVVGAAGPMPSAPPRAMASVPPMMSSPAPGPVKAKPKETDGHAPTKPATTPATPTPAPKPALSKIETPKQSDAQESALDSMFARLTTQSPATPSRATEGISLAGPDKSIFSFEDRSGATNRPTEALQSYTANLPKTCVKPEQSESAITIALPEKKTEQAKKVVPQEEAKNIKQWQNMSPEDLENEYLRKASDYVNALPDHKGTTAYTFKVVSKKLRTSYVPDVRLDPESNEILKARYVFAMINYVNKVLKKGTKPLTADFVKQVLKDNDGNFLSLCARLVEEKYITLENMTEVTGLCRTILDILPKAEPTVTTPVRTVTPTAAAPLVEETKPMSTDPVDNMTAWPSPEKRDNAATYRTCILKGVSGIASINQLQALVWCGRLESISMPEKNSDFALVRFLTPEACQKYFEATANGIEIDGDKKTVVFVERTAGPNSINDVIRNCTEGDASRCVRAVGADEDWSDMLLMKLARGKGQVKREVDRIKRGKTARGYHYVEFRFANIYNALNFKRELMDDHDWEHCTISYAPDPCETARGVHFNDEDEGGSGFFA